MEDSEVTKRQAGGGAGLSSHLPYAPFNDGFGGEHSLPDCRQLHVQRGPGED